MRMPLKTQQYEVRMAAGETKPLQCVLANLWLHKVRLICVALIAGLGCLRAGAGDSAPKAPTGRAQEPAFPEYLGSYHDPLTGHLVTRVTGDKNLRISNTMINWGGRTRSVYNLKQVWSAVEHGINNPSISEHKPSRCRHRLARACCLPQTGAFPPNPRRTVIAIRSSPISARNSRRR